MNFLNFQASVTQSNSIKLINALHQSGYNALYGCAKRYKCFITRYDRNVIVFVGKADDLKNLTNHLIKKYTPLNKENNFDGK